MDNDISSQEATEERIKGLVKLIRDCKVKMPGSPEKGSIDEIDGVELTFETDNGGRIVQYPWRLSRRYRGYLLRENVEYIYATILEHTLENKRVLVADYHLRINCRDGTKIWDMVSKRRILD